MYEPFFGLRARPFASAPDPDFYFESRAHHRALAYLRHGIDEGDSFMVMTGEIGAGKTTLIQKLLRELDARGIEAALLVSSQLDARELLVAAAGAFGALPGAGTTASADELRARLRGVLSERAARGRRPLLVIDEAQNLQPDAIELLSEFAAQQAEGTLALQVLLVGQPELRASIERGGAPQHRQAVFVYCHIGCLGEHETRAYIEHRLRHVGWTGSPSFEPAAHQRIHALAEGVPRRINRLCDRLLLAAYLRAQTSISPRLVDQVDAELRGELGDLVAPARQQKTLPVEVPVPTSRPGPRPGRPIPTLSAFVSPQPSVAREPAANPAPRAAAWTPPPAAGVQPQPQPPLHRRAKPPAAVALLATAAAVVAAVLGAWWLGQRPPQGAPSVAAPAPSPANAPAAPPAPAADAPPESTPANPAPCSPAVVALGLCAPLPSQPASKE